jgi:hypothetical protein
MTVSFDKDIKPLFRMQDVNCMNLHNVMLASYAYMSDPKGDEEHADHANAKHVHARLAGTETPRMPKGGPFWPQANLDLLQQWMDGGFAP